MTTETTITPADGKTNKDAAEGTETVENTAPAKAGEVQVTGETDPNGNPLVDTGMPEGGHEKYWNAEAKEYNWEAHARELAWQGEQQQASTDEKDMAKATENADGAAAEAANAAGVNIDEFNAHVAEHGEVSADHLKQFEDAGIPPEVVKDYVALKVSEADRHLSAISDYIGGEAAIAGLNEYLAEHYTPAEIEAFNEQLMRPATWRTTAAFLMQEAGMPRAGRGIIKGQNEQNASSEQGESFASDAEFNTAMRDPRYKSDPAYRARVTAALRRSPHLMGR